MNRTDYLRRLSNTLGRRRVVYFGTRGADARSLTDLMNFELVFSQIAPSGLAGVEEYCLEEMTRKRVDLDTYNVDTDVDPEVANLRATVLDAFDQPAAVIPYRSCALLASAWFPRSEKVLHLGNFHELQSTFEHKPWVETQLAAAGIRTIPWRYFADNERPLIEEILATRTMVVRTNRSDGGTGVRLVHSAADLASSWPAHSDGFVAIAPFLDGTPINVNGVVFPDGQVSRHGASIQLIGIPACTARRFGYCGNDFGAAASLDDRDIRALDELLAAVGLWLAQHGYRGAFGIDAILAADGAYLVELNPRFQGSSRLSASIDVEDGRADMFLAHLGAFLGEGAPDDASLRDLVRRPPRSHLLVHARAAQSVQRQCGFDTFFDTDLVPSPNITVEQGAIVADLVFRAPISPNGTTLSPLANLALESWHE